jgi:hypothetical protein
MSAQVLPIDMGMQRPRLIDVDGTDSVNQAPIPGRLEVNRGDLVPGLLASVSHPGGAPGDSAAIAGARPGPADRNRTCICRLGGGRLAH